MNVYIRLKNEEGYSLNEYKYLNKCKSEFDDAFYSPFEEIITLAITIIGAGGGSKIIIELIKKFSKSVKIKRNTMNDIEVDCTNCSVEEVKQILEILDKMGTGEHEGS
ncbi:MAG: hypothetical protein HFH78_04930 [Lachnospiraceae bacterium]|jgi:hypothetical protein|nr:hypothetical protein [Lachnospiraceae bacterium]